MIKHLFAVSCVSLGIFVTPLAGQTTIDKVAPENSVLIVGVKNVASSLERLKKTSLWALWNDDKLKKTRDEQLKKFTDEMNKNLEELGVEKDSLVPPSGPAGFALFPVNNPDTGQPTPAFIVLADYGDDAEKTDALVQAALAKGEKDGDIEFEHKDINGRTVYSIDMTKLEKKAKEAAQAARKAAGEAEGDGDADMDAGMGLPPGVPNPKDMVGEVTKFHYVRDGHTLMLSNEMSSITEALDMVDGKGGKSVTERKEFQALTSKIGDNDLYGLLLTRDITSMTAGNDEMGMAQMLVPMIRAAFGHVYGYAMGVRIDGPTAMVEQTFAAYMPDGKAGLTTLVDSGTARGSLPSFVGPETVTYATFNFEFSGLMDVVHKIVEANPMLKAQAGEVIDQAEPDIRKVTATLGNQVHFATTVSKPITETSHKTVWAIQCTNPQEFENLFANWASQAGFESRDFLGQRIYSMKPEMMEMMPGVSLSEPLSLGIGGGYVLAGPTAGVEQALRASSQTGAASLSTDAAFQRAVGALSKDPAVAWGYSLTIDSMEATIKARKASDLKSVEDIKQFDPEGAAKYQKQIEESYKAIDAMDFDLLRKYMGPMVWQIRATDDGFVGNSFLLSAQPMTAK